MALPTNPPSIYDRGREVWNVGQVAANRPEKYGSFVRAKGQSDDVWFTHVAYWMTYPDAPTTVDPKAPAQGIAWHRIQADIRKAIDLPKDTAGTPTQPASQADRLLEIWNVGQVVASRPEVYDGRSRKADQQDDVWFTNVAYWMTYPEAPIATTTPAEIAAWLRIQEDIRKALALPKGEQGQPAATATPSLPPSALDRTREVWNVGQIVASRPDKYGSQSRKPDQTEDDWLANVAYWTTYPGAANKSTMPAEVAAWVRLREDIRKAIFLQKNPAPWVMTKPTWPLGSAPKMWKSGSRFKAKRPWSGPQTRYHAGTDLAAVAGTAVLAPEAGTIVAPNSGWESSVDPVTKQVKGVKAIIVRTDSGRTILLGGIKPGSATVGAGGRVEAGQKIAEVGKYPGGSSMLHVQLYDSPLTEPQVNGLKSWKLGAPQPKYLVDSGPYLEAAMTNAKFVPTTAAVAVPAAAMAEEIEEEEKDEGTVAGDAASVDTAPPPSGSGSGSSPPAATNNASPMLIAAVALAAIGVGSFLFR